MVGGKRRGSDGRGERGREEACGENAKRGCGERVERGVKRGVNLPGNSLTQLESRVGRLQQLALDGAQLRTRAKAVGARTEGIRRRIAGVPWHIPHLPVPCAQGSFGVCSTAGTARCVFERGATVT